MLRRTGETAPRVRLDRFLPADGSCSLQVDAEGARWLSVHTRAPGVYRLHRYRIADDHVHAVDVTGFELGEARFAEVERFTSAGGPNLHAVPLVLPAVLEVGRFVHPVVGRPGRVTALYAGPVELELGEDRGTIEAVALVAEEGGRREVQWRGLGIGELGLGPLGRPLRRWTVAHDGWLRGVPDQIRSLERRPLPESASGSAPGGLF